MNSLLALHPDTLFVSQPMQDLKFSVETFKTLVVVSIVSTSPLQWREFP